MNCPNNNIFVKYDLTHNKEFDLGNGVKLIRPDAWHVNDNSLEDTTKTESNVNKLEVHPQIATVVHGNRKFPYHKGDKVFLHYMAFEWAEEFNIDGEPCTLVDADYVLFVIKDEEFVMPSDYYLGEQVYKEGEKTASGIYLTSQAEVKVAMEIKITHKPANCDFVDIGETVLTVDDKQYVLKINNKEYVWLKKSEIVAKVTENLSSVA